MRGSLLACLHARKDSRTPEHTINLSYGNCWAKNLDTRIDACYPRPQVQAMFPLAYYIRLCPRVCNRGTQPPTLQQQLPTISFGDASKCRPLFAVSKHRELINNNHQPTQHAIIGNQRSTSQANDCVVEVNESARHERRLAHFMNARAPAWA